MHEGRMLLYPAILHHLIRHVQVPVAANAIYESLSVQDKFIDSWVAISHPIWGFRLLLLSLLVDLSW